MDSAPDKIDREKMTPFLLRLFYRSGGYHRVNEFDPHGELPPHCLVYTWQSCTLRELAHLLTSALPDLLPDPAIGTRLAFKLFWPDTRNSGPNAPARYLTKELGSVIIGEGGSGVLPDDEVADIVEGGQMDGHLGGEPDKTLRDAKFVIGDYVTCAILPPLANGSVAPPPGRVGFNNRGGGFAGDRFVPGGSRENGFGYRGRGGGPRGGGGFGESIGAGGVPSGEWRRGERVPEGPSGGRGRGYGGGFGGRGRW